MESVSMPVLVESMPADILHLPTSDPERSLPARSESTAGRVVTAVLIALITAVIAFWAFIRNNDFPVNYHPDEASKAAQIMDTENGRNFNHPVLLLETTNIIKHLLRTDSSDEFSVVRAGRITSALFGAAAVFFFSFTA